MKFLTSLFLGIAIAVVGFLCIPLFTGKCEHAETYKYYYFEPQDKQATNYIKVRCKECNGLRSTYLFNTVPSDLSYLDVLNGGEHFVEGEYYTITAPISQTYPTNKGKLGFLVENNDVEVFFGATFKEEYIEEISSLNKGDTITFRGKASPEGRLYWTDCELITG